MGFLKDPEVTSLPCPFHPVGSQTTYLPISQVLFLVFRQRPYPSLPLPGPAPLVPVSAVYFPKLGFAPTLSRLSPPNTFQFAHFSFQCDVTNKHDFSVLQVTDGQKVEAPVLLMDGPSFGNS